MLNQNYTAELLNLEDVIPTNVENIDGEVHVYIELPRKLRAAITKVLKRVCFGMSNFRNFRNRILFCQK